MNQNDPAPLWGALAKLEPQVFLAMGDNAYIDSENPKDFAKAYRTLAENQDYQQFAKTIPILATWDDHDYGVNDGGADFAAKETAKQAFLEFYRPPGEKEIRQREGIYHSLIVGPEGKRVQFIMLDTRSFRSPLKHNWWRWLDGKKYRPERTDKKTLLGPLQWAWLLQELQKPADLRIIVSSIQMINSEHGWEKWSNLPEERDKLLRMIKNSGANRVIFLSGDRHHANISRIDKGESVPYDVYDITASGINRARPEPEKEEADRYRLGKIVYKDNMGYLLINWEKQVVVANIIDAEGKVQLNRVIPFHTIERRQVKPARSAI